MVIRGWRGIRGRNKREVMRNASVAGCSFHFDVYFLPCVHGRIISMRIIASRFS